MCCRGNDRWRPVSNFVSGLVILFEGPVKVGDAVQIGDVQRDVRRIGIRSSTVRTYEGADVIVPNSALVAEKVTNWTRRTTSGDAGA